MYIFSNKYWIFCDFNYKINKNQKKEKAKWKLPDYY